MKNIKILLCTHKQVQLPNNEIFYPIQAGKALSTLNLPIIHDDKGINISEKNKSYCELTCHYWAWKNLKDVDIIGLNHYRRYFDFIRINTLFPAYRKFCSIDDFFSNSYTFPDLEKLLTEFDIILPTKRNFPYSNATQYAVSHIIDDWNILKDVIKDISPEYIPAFEKTMERNNALSNYNMFITQWQLFEEYSDWLFRILFEVEKICKISEYPVQARIFGYMSERLLNVFCEFKKLKIKHIPLILPIEDFSPDVNKSDLVYYLWKIKNNLAFKISTF